MALLMPFPSDEIESAIIPFLDDASYSGGADKWSKRVYPLRSLAYGVLSGYGGDVRKPVVEEATRYAPIYRSAPAATVSAAIALLVAALLIRRRFRAAVAALAAAAFGLLL